MTIELRLGTAALALAMISQGAAAQEWSARVGGYIKGGVGYVDVGQDGNDLGVVREAELHFRFQTATDNGLTFGTYFELDANDTANDDSSSFFDEANLFFAGDFGRVEIGEQDGAGDQLTLTPPGCSISCAADNDGFLFDWYDDDSGLDLINDGADSSDDLKITYLTPSINSGGFFGKAGVSWAPTTEDNGVATSLDATKEENFVELGARGGFDLGSVLGDSSSFEASAAYFTADSFESDSYVFAATLSAFGGAIGTRYSYRDTSKGEDEDSLSVGAEYGTGPWGFYANYTTILDSAAPDRAKEDWGVSLEADYNVAPGVTVAGIVEFGDATGFEDSFAIGTVLYLKY